MPSYPGGVGLTIGIPSDAKPVTLEWAFGLMNLHAPTNFDIRWAMVKGKPVAEARTMIVEAALQQKAKYLFFLGTDVTVPPYCVRQLIFHLEHFPKFGVAGGVYCHKSQPQEPLVYRGNGQGPYWDWKVGEVFDVSGIGMDATLIRMDVFKNFPQPWFKTVEQLEAFYDGENKAEHWTEDLFFCKKVAERCCHCGLLEPEHEDRNDKGQPTSKEDGHKFEQWQVLADGGLLCKHWDNLKGISYELPLASKPYRAVFKIGPKRVVDLGCGNLEESYKTNEGETLRVDIREDVKPDYRCDIRRTPFANEWFDVVYSSHTLEHFSRNEVPLILDEMCRILKPDGELRLVLPNLKWAAERIMNGEVDADVLNVLYGGQEYAENFHKIGFVSRMIEQLLTARGFTRFDWDYEHYHMMLRSWRKVPADGVAVMNPVMGWKEVEVGEKIPDDVPKTSEKVEVPKDSESSSVPDFAAAANDGTVKTEMMTKEELEKKPDGVQVEAVVNYSKPRGGEAFGMEKPEWIEP